MTTQQLLPPITVTGTYSDYAPTGGYFDTLQSPSSSSNTDLSPVVVTAQKIPVPFSIYDWLQPPKVFLVLGIGAVSIYLLMGTKKRRRKR